ncbi:MAG: hypothetical protein ACREP6_15050, partial [Candidatus Binataceae bacterium]
IVNGSNVPMEMAPISNSYKADSGDPYSCQSPGSPAASPTGLAGCDWKFTPGVINGSDQTSLLRLVQPHNFYSASACPSGSAWYSTTNVCQCGNDSQCSSQGLVCGLTLGQIIGQPHADLGEVCGNAIGEWSADQICGEGDHAWSSPDGSLNCAEKFPLNASLNGTTTLSALFLCPKGGAVSCSNDNPAPNADCCGCATDATNPLSSDWPSVLGIGFQCYSNNPTWASNVQNWLAFMKRACPTAYTYPYDDATSTFTCLSNGEQAGVGYQVTFCPAS